MQLVGLQRHVAVAVRLLPLILVGGVAFEDKAWAPAFDETGGWRAGYQAIGQKFGFASTLPILEHGELQLFQTAAIETYLASIATKVFPDLTPKQQAVDLMFGQIKADLNAATESLLFKKIKPEELPPIVEKWYGIIEGLLPETGFINGLATPTMADLAVLVIAQGCMPFQAGPKIAGFDWTGKCVGAPPSCTPPPTLPFLARVPAHQELGRSVRNCRRRYPKMTRVAADAAAFPAIAEFLAASEHKTLKADPFGIMG